LARQGSWPTFTGQCLEDKPKGNSLHEDSGFIEKETLVGKTALDGPGAEAPLDFILASFLQGATS
jgi:hypothetical protein